MHLKASRYLSGSQRQRKRHIATAGGHGGSPVEHALLKGVDIQAPATAMQARIFCSLIHHHECRSSACMAYFGSFAVASCRDGSSVEAWHTRLRAADAFCLLSEKIALLLMDAFQDLTGLGVCWLDPHASEAKGWTLTQHFAGTADLVNASKCILKFSPNDSGLGQEAKSLPRSAKIESPPACVIMTGNALSISSFNPELTANDRISQSIRRDRRSCLWGKIRRPGRRSNSAGRVQGFTWCSRRAATYRCALPAGLSMRLVLHCHIARNCALKKFALSKKGLSVWPIAHLHRASASAVCVLQVPLLEQRIPSWSWCKFSLMQRCTWQVPMAMPQ